MTPTLRVNTELDGTRMVRGMSQMSNEVKQWANQMKGYIAAAFSVGAIAQFGRSTAEYFVNVGDSAGRLDIAVEKFQALVQVAKLAGKELGDVEKLLNQISNAQVEAIRNPSGPAAQSFKGMGMSPAQLNKMTISEVLQQMGQSMSGMNRQQIKGATEGIVGPKEIGVLNSLTPAMAVLPQITSTMIANGQIASRQQISELKQMQDDFDVAVSRIKTTLLPFINNVLTALGIAFEALELFFKGTANLIKSIFTSMTGKEAGDLNKKLKAEFDKKQVERQKILTQRYLDPLERAIAQAGGRRGVHVEGEETPPDIGPSMTERAAEFRKQINVWQQGLQSSLGIDRSGIHGPVNVPMSNFLGRNIGVIDVLAKEQVTLLRRIELNTRKLETLTAIENNPDIFGLPR